MTARIEEDALTVRLYRRIGCAEAMIEFPKNEWLSLVADWNSLQLAGQKAEPPAEDE